MRRLTIQRRGITLMELIIVLIVLMALAAIAVPLLVQPSEEVRKQTTIASMTQLRDVLMGTYRLDMGKTLPRPGAYGINTKGRVNKPQIRYLFVNPSTEGADDPTNAANVQSTYDPVARLGWRGPYLLLASGQYTTDTDWNADAKKSWAISGFSADYGVTGDPAIIDGWGNPIVIVETFGSDGAMHAELRSAGANNGTQAGKMLYSLNLGEYEATKTNNLWLKLY